MSLTPADAALLACWVRADWTRAARSVHTGAPVKPEFIGGTLRDPAFPDATGWNATHGRLWVEGPARRRCTCCPGPS